MRCSFSVAVADINSVVRVHQFELLGSTEQTWGVAGEWKIYPLKLGSGRYIGLLQEKARRLHVIILIILWILCSRNTEAAVPSTVLVSFSLYNSGDDGKLRMSFFFL